MNGFKISNRLEKVAECVMRGNRVADIGCDHAYTAIYLIKNNIAKNVIALDINKGPLQKAKKNIETYECKDFIETRLSDGAKELIAGEVDTILISGMGGRLTNKILSDSKDVVDNCTQLVLQPQSEIHLVREYLYKIGFNIVYEDMIIDEEKYYVIINAKKKVNHNINETEYNNVKSEISFNDYLDVNDNVDINEVFNKYGEYLLNAKNDVLYKYLLKEKAKNNDITCTLEKNLENKEKDEEYNRIINRVNELKREDKLIREALKYYEW